MTWKHLSCSPPWPMKFITILPPPPVMFLTSKFASQRQEEGKRWPGGGGGGEEGGGLGVLARLQAYVPAATVALWQSIHLLLLSHDTSALAAGRPVSSGRLPWLPTGKEEKTSRQQPQLARARNSMSWQSLLPYSSWPTVTKQRTDLTFDHQFKSLQLRSY